MPDLELYKEAVLTRDLPGDGLRAGDVGTIVDRHVAPNVPEVGYSVEFFDMTGRTVAVITVPESAVRAPTESDRPSVRTMTNSVSGI